MYVVFYANVCWLLRLIQYQKIFKTLYGRSWEVDGETVKQCQTFFEGAPNSLQMVIAAMKLKDAYPLEEKL